MKTKKNNARGELDPFKVVMMCLLHDLAEARTADHNWIHKRYVKIFEDEVHKEQLGTLPYPDMEEFIAEYDKRESKEAVIAKEHAGKDLDCAVFFMDIRTHGKDFERFYNSAKEKHGVRFIRKPSVEAAKDIPDASLDFVYIDGAHDIQSVVNDIHEWQKKVRPDGIVYGHDYKRSTNPRVVHHVKDAVPAYCYAYRIKQIDNNGSSRYTDAAEVDVGLAPRVFNLSQNYPNPFNPATTLRFSVADARFVTLKVFDILGREVATLVNEQLRPGNYSIQWNGSSLASGVYFYRIEAGNFRQTKKMLLQK